MALLKKFESLFGTIHVTRSKTDGSLAYYQNGSFHSQADKKGISLCLYVHLMKEIIRQTRARNVLVIGCAGGTLATMLRQQNCKVTVVDINPVAFAIARAHFLMPDSVRCIRRCGIAYLRLTKRRYDAVVVDVFGAHNNVPHLFTTESFFTRVAKVLSSSGIMIMNVITANDQDKRAETIARNAQSAALNVTVFDFPRHKDRNTLIVGGDIHKASIPSGQEPSWMKKELADITRRKLPGKNAAKTQVPQKVR